MTLSDFEDPTELSRCSRSDCNRYRLSKDVSLCAQHLRDQERSSAGYTEPDLEARLATIRTEDDDHPGQKKVWIDEDRFEWVDDPDAVVQAGKAGIHRAFGPAGMPSSEELYVGPDPDTVFSDRSEQPFSGRPAAPRQADQSSRPPASSTGCWVAYHSDWSGLALFADELEALRHAVANNQSVGWASWGEELGGGRYPGTGPS